MLEILPHKENRVTFEERSLADISVTKVKCRVEQLHGKFSLTKLIITSTY